MVFGFLVPFMTLVAVGFEKILSELGNQIVQFFAHFYYNKGLNSIGNI